MLPHQTETVSFFYANGAAIQDEIKGQIISTTPVEGSPNSVVLLKTPQAILKVIACGGEALDYRPYRGPDLEELQTKYGVKPLNYPLHENSIDD